MPGGARRTDTDTERFAHSDTIVGVMDAPDDGPNPNGDDHGPLEPSAAAAPERIDPERLPVAALPAATPPAPVRALAFASIVIAGLCGGLIGYAFTDLQCGDGCTAAAGLGGIVGAIIGAAGVAIVAVLVLRAMDEWESVKTRDAAGDRSRDRRDPR